MMSKMLKMQMLEDEDDLAYETEIKPRTASTSDNQPAWMRTIHATAFNWLQLIPQMVNPLKRTVENIKVTAAAARLRSHQSGEETRESSVGWGGSGTNPPRVWDKMERSSVLILVPFFPPLRIRCSASSSAR